MNKKFDKKYWYFFPPQVIAFFVKEYKEGRIYLASLSREEKKELFRKKRRHFISGSISLILHIVFFVSIFNGFFTPVLTGTQTMIARSVVDFDLMDGMVSVDGEPVYDKDSNIIINSHTLLGEKQDRALSHLLNKLKKSNNPVLSSSVNKLEKRPKLKSQLAQVEQNLKAGWGFEYKKKIGRRTKPSTIQMWNNMRLLSDSVGDGEANYASIMKVIDSRNFQFRDCYEQALLKDEKLSIKAEIFLTLNQTQVARTKLKLKGNGNVQSRRALSRCLFRESKFLVFSKNKKNVLVKFNLVFGL